MIVAEKGRRVIMQQGKHYVRLELLVTSFSREK